MPKDKKGNKISWKEFMVRWKGGIQNISSYQQLKTEMVGTRIILLGLLCGIIVSIYKFQSMWWVTIILVGAILNTGLSYLSQRQKFKFLEKMEKM